MPIRIGQIPYLNSEVFYYGLQGRDVVLTPLAPRALSAAAGEGRIDAGPVPLVTCFELEETFQPLGNFCIATTDRARSILFYSKRPIEQLDGASIAITGQTSTTVRLLKVLLAHRYHVQPREFAPLPLVLSASNGNGTASAPNWDAFLLIGDDALRNRRGVQGYPHCYDLGEVWNQWTGLPFVFAQWVVRKDLPKEQSSRLCEWLEESITQGIADVDAIAARRRDLNMTRAEVVEYVLSFHYRLGRPEMEAIERFRGLLGELLPSPLVGEGQDGGLLTERARQMRKNPSEAENALWYHLRYKKLNGLKFRRQANIGKYFCDFVCFEKRLVIEVGGGQHADQVEYDEARTKWLEGQGFRVLRFWNNKVLSNIDVVMEVIWGALEADNSPPPVPSPIKGEGYEKLSSY